MDIEEVAANRPEKILKEFIDPAVGFRGFQARKLAFGLGLPSELIGKAAVGSLESGIFTAEAWPEISRSAAEVGAFLKTLGPLNGIELLERTDQEGNRVYRYRLRYKDTNLFFVMMLNQEGKIARLNLQPE